jgi:hypothetical protein
VYEIKYYSSGLMKVLTYNILPDFEECGQHKMRFSTPGFEVSEGIRISFMLGD